MNSEATTEVGIRRIGDETRSGGQDVVAVEEPLEIRIDCKPIVVTMRTPGCDRELAAGFLWTEGVIRRMEDIESIEHCSGSETGNVITVRLAASARFDPSKLERNFYATSSCGICGKATLDAIEQLVEPIDDLMPLDADSANAVRLNAGFTLTTSLTAQRASSVRPNAVLEAAKLR